MGEIVNSTPPGPTSTDPADENFPAENAWTIALRHIPDHARGYAERWRRIEASGKDIHGEARLIDAMAERGSRVLDAGCGTGRLGGYLARVGHHVTGVDLDATLIGVAREDHPDGRWEVGDLAQLDLRDSTGEQEQFDVVVCAGNVMAFLAGSERVPALTRIARHLAPAGRFVVGFGSGRGYPFGRFEADAATAGLEVQQRFSSWDLQPPSDDFLVAVLVRGM